MHTIGREKSVDEGVAAHAGGFARPGIFRTGGELARKATAFALQKIDRDAQRFPFWEEFGPAVGLCRARLNRRSKQQFVYVSPQLQSQRAQPQSIAQDDFRIEPDCPPPKRKRAVEFGPQFAELRADAICRERGYPCSIGRPVRQGKRAKHGCNWRYLAKPHTGLPYTLKRCIPLVGESLSTGFSSATTATARRRRHDDCCNCSTPAKA